jgi:hypothetical protein
LPQIASFFLRQSTVLQVIDVRAVFEFRYARIDVVIDTIEVKHLAMDEDVRRP